MLVGCPSMDLRALAWGLLAGKEVTTGFMAFLTFAPLCAELDVYGFAGSNTADGHVEWSEHPLDTEHYLEHQIGRKDWADMALDYERFPGLKQFWPWYKDQIGYVV